SPDPVHEVKAARVLALYRKQPANGVVISFDEKGPESLARATGVAGHPVAGPSVTAPPSPAARGSATWWVRSTFTPTTCAQGSGRAARRSWVRAPSSASKTPGNRGFFVSRR